MQTRRKTGRRFQLELMEGRVSLSGIGRSLPPTAPPAFGPVAYGSKAGCAGDGLVPLTFGPVTSGSKTGGVGDGLVPLTFGPVAYGSNAIRFGREGNADEAVQKVREA
jgi:hypothetical protein